VNPYGAPAGGATSATLQGAAGTFTVLPGQEMRAGRDATQCGILLAEPRVSGVHATLKLEHGQLLVRDENSNNGTLVNGARIAPGIWSPVPSGSILRFGPVEFSAHVS
jgi:pSer/pThr/pTyr-binding forkhead associated (FHA) protein